MKFKAINWDKNWDYINMKMSTKLLKLEITIENENRKLSDTNNLHRHSKTTHSTMKWVRVFIADGEPARVLRILPEVCFFPSIVSLDFSFKCKHEWGPLDWLMWLRPILRVSPHWTTCPCQTWHSCQLLEG